MSSSSLESYLLSVINADAPLAGPGPGILRGILGGCSRLYEAALEGYLAAERIGLRRRTSLPVPVLSIGNLTVGGTGKTPMTQLICRKLTESGKRVGVLSRGHGGEGPQVRVVSGQDGQLCATAAEAGDEPILLAQSLPGIPVTTGKDRRLSGREALRRFALDVLVLDDGFQYWQLARDLDLILLDARSPFDNGRSLPRGLLREPARHLSRAGMVVVTRSETLDAAARAELCARIEALAPGIRVFFARHAPEGFLPLGGLNGEPSPVAEFRGKRIVALSGIAQPESFRRSLTDAAGSEVVEHVVWDDHHTPTLADVEAVYRTVGAMRAEALVMTEKDAVKWPKEIPAGCPTYVLRIAMQVEDETRFLMAIRKRLFSGIHAEP